MKKCNATRDRDSAPCPPLISFSKHDIPVDCPEHSVFVDFSQIEGQCYCGDVVGGVRRPVFLIFQDPKDLKSKALKACFQRKGINILFRVRGHLLRVVRGQSWSSTC